MATAVVAVVGVLALVVFWFSGAVIELFRDVRQLREVAGILDRPLEVDLGDVEGSRPSRAGLPESLDSAGTALVLFLSDRCGTCHALAAGFAGTLPQGVWGVLEARTQGAAREFVASHGLEEAVTRRRLVIDVAGQIARQIGLRTTPVGFWVESGRFTRATTIPSGRYLSSVLPNPVKLDGGPTASWTVDRSASMNRQER